MNNKNNMDDYEKIKQIFEEFYSKRVENKLNKYELERMLSLVLTTLSIVIVGGPILFVLVAIITNIISSPIAQGFNMIIYVFLILFFILLVDVLFFSIGYNTRDIRIKRDFFIDFFGRIYKIADLKWANADIGPNYFVEMMNNHKIININKSVFATNDNFSCFFHNVYFEIYEITNKNSLATIAKKICIWGVITFVITLFSFAISCPIYYLLKLIMPISIIHKEYSHLLVFILLEIILICIIKGLLCIIDRRKISLNFDTFKGLLIEFNYKKHINAHTIIIENNEENMFIKLFLPKGYQKVQLEDERFNAKFSVYSTDQIEARYAMTTAMMDRLLNLKHNFRSKYIRASFRYNKFVIAIQADKDMFKLASLWKKTDETMYKTMVIELISILKITDALHLNDETGM